ncbi:MAG: metallophosphoesterase [Candidatus Pacebacteria bacterium]|nr:metallophosphoesterase [Candidatus Paceibacterota bacterium]
MKISILQLSDIHFVKSNNTILNKINSIYDAIKNEIDNSEYLFIVFTGDIAFSGQRLEYDEAESFINNLNELIHRYNEKIKIELIFTSGNHDCDFSGNQEIRNMIVGNVIQNQTIISEEIINQCTAIQKEYFEFVNKMNNEFAINKSISNKLLTRYEYKIDKYLFVFNSYNLAWISKRDESQSNIVFPTNLFEKNNLLSDDIDLTISLFHHPLHWLEHQNIRLFKELINSTSNIVLTGHEHTHSAKKESHLTSQDHIQYIEAGVLQNNKDENNSSFNLIKIDIDERKQDVFEFKWKKGLYEKENEYVDIQLPFKKKSIYQLKETYRYQINEMTLKITHPNKNKITLEDIYIYPYLNIISTSHKEKNLFTEFNSEKFKNINEIGHTIIYGAETSGKTSLARTLQLKYKRDGLIPIIINGKDIKSNNIYSDTIKDMIKKSFKIQYVLETNTMSKFEQADKKDVILIIDDFNDCNLNSENKAKFISTLGSINYKNILVFANDSLLFEGTTEGELAKSLLDYKHYKILEFGHKLRDKLIKKWILMGDNGSIEHNDLIHQIREKANTINTTIGYNIVPSYPVYLLTLLQAMEANESHSLSKSAYGHYYEFLIMKYLNSDDPMQPKDIKTIFTYASTLAFNCLKSKQYIMSHNELINFDKEYCREKKFTPSFNLIEKLLNSHILTEYEDELKFSHDYIYYFFVAKYLSDNIGKSYIQEIVSNMCQRLYRTEFANILMFLIHHSPQDFILENIIIEAKKVFENIKEFTFSLHEISKINSSIASEILKLENRTIEKTRDIELNQHEKRDNFNKNIIEQNPHDADYEEDIQDLNQFASLNLAFKIIEILGEITKNYAGSLDGNIKYDLIKETYSLGLRSLKSLIEFFENNHDLLIEEIKNILDKKQIVTGYRISETEANIIFSMVSTISTGIVKKIAKSVASKELEDIYKEILSEDEDNIALQLITNAINLDFKNGLKIHKIESLHKQFEHDNNKLSDSVIKKLVLEHIYMFDVEVSKKQSICSKLGIGVETSTKEMLKQLKR